MHGFRKKYFLTAAILFLPIFIAFSPETITGPIKSHVILIFKVPFVLADNLSRGLRDSISLKGLFLQQLNKQDLRIKTLETENASVRELLLENQRLKELLNFKQNFPFKVVPVQVIARDPANWRHTIIIDKGLSSGIKKNNFVISQQGLVGRVCESGRAASKAILLTDPDFRVAGIDQRSREQMIILGNGRNLCVMKYLAPDSDIQAKDVIVTSGLGGFCPKGVVIGEVANVRKSADGLTQDAYVKPAVRLSSIEEVAVLLE